MGMGGGRRGGHTHPVHSATSGPSGPSCAFCPPGPFTGSSHHPLLRSLLTSVFTCRVWVPQLTGLPGGLRGPWLRVTSSHPGSVTNARLTLEHQGHPSGPFPVPTLPGRSHVACHSELSGHGGFVSAHVSFEIDRFPPAPHFTRNIVWPFFPLLSFCLPP